MDLFYGRFFLADISGQIVEIIQPVIVEARTMDPSDLRDKMPVLRPYRRLDIALDRKDAALFQLIALKHPVHAVLRPVSLCSAFYHLLADIDDLI